MNNNRALNSDITTLTSQYTKGACNALLPAINHNITLKSDITTLTSYYTKVPTDGLLLTINNNNIGLKATHSTTYTKLETYGRTETYTTTEVKGLIQSQCTEIASLSMGINLTTGKLMICRSPEYYDSLDAKLNKTVGDVSIAIDKNMVLMWPYSQIMLRETLS